MKRFVLAAVLVAGCAHETKSEAASAAAAGAASRSSRRTSTCRRGGTTAEALRQPRRPPPRPHHASVPEAQTLLRSGPAPDLRLQPRRGAALVRRGGGAGSVVRDVLLGRRARARAEHQPAGRRRSREEGGRALGEGASGRRARVARRAARSSRRCQALRRSAARRRTTEARQTALDEAYADAMRDVAKQFPADDDVQVLFAESMMDLRPWRLWEPDGKPAPGTDEIVATLEKVLARTPQHPGANHYYIHAIEASPHPEKAMACADRIGGMMPGAGHIVHMPSHIYQRVGRYNDAAEANRQAIAADKKYTGTIGDPGYYAMYVAHNFQFLWAAALMAGRGDESVSAARDMLKLVPAEMWKQMPEVSFVDRGARAVAGALRPLGRGAQGAGAAGRAADADDPPSLRTRSRARRARQARRRRRREQRRPTSSWRRCRRRRSPGSPPATSTARSRSTWCAATSPAAAARSPTGWRACESRRRRRRLPLRRAARLVLPAAADARRLAAARQEAGRRGARVRRGSEEEPGQRLGAHRLARSAERAEEADRRRRRAPDQGVARRRRQGRLLRFLATRQATTARRCSFVGDSARESARRCAWHARCSSAAACVFAHSSPSSLFYPPVAEPSRLRRRRATARSCRRSYAIARARTSR